MAKLTDNSVKNLEGGVVRTEIPDHLVPGLYLICQPSGTKSWAVRYRSGGRTRKHTLGSYPVVPLKNARELGRTALLAVASGRDPAAEKIAARKSGEEAIRAERDRFERAVDLYVERYVKPNLKASTAREAERLLRVNVVPHWRTRRIQDIGRRDVVHLLDAIMDRGAGITANRTLATLRRLFGFLVERGVLDANPCTGVKPPAPETSRDRVLTDDELRALWRACDGMAEAQGSAVRMLILTGQRRDEVAEMVWPEVELATKVWVIPAHRAKNSTAHEVPLSDQAMAVLSRLHRIAGEKQFVFTPDGEKPISGFGWIKEQLDRALPDAPRWTIHDLRRTCATRMIDIGIMPHVVEAILNHISGHKSGVAGIYNRAKYVSEKRAALAAWGRHVEGLVSGAPAGNVVEMRARA